MNLREQARPTKALKVLAIAVLVVLTILLAVTGVLYLTRATPARVVHAFGDLSGPAAPEDPQFRRTIDLMTGAALRPGHSIEILNNGDETFPRLWRDIRAARSSVTVQVYFANPGELAASLKAALVERARAGVRTHFLYDGFGAAALTDGYLDSLRTAGVRVAVFRPVKWHALHKAQHRSHVRAVVIDGAVAYTGGYGIDDRWLGGGRSAHEWRDVNVRFTGPAVGQLQAAFAVAWTEATGELLVGDLFFPPADTTAGEGLVAGLLHASPPLGSTPAERLVALTIASARQRLYIANSYLVPSGYLHGALIAAAARGVDVRLLLPSERTDVPLARFAAHSFYRSLLAAGVRIFEYQPTMMHAKTFVVDGVWSTVGTLNLDNRSLALNDESTLLVLDGGIGARMDSLFLDDLTRASEVRLDAFEARSWFARLREWGARRLVNFL